MQGRPHEDDTDVKDDKGKRTDAFFLAMPGLAWVGTAVAGFAGRQALGMAMSMVNDTLMSSAQTYALQTCQSLFAGSVTSMLTAGATALGGRLLMQSFGGTAVNGLTGMLSASLSQAMRGFSLGTAAIKPDPVMERRLAQLEAQGATPNVLAQLAGLTQHRVGVALMVMGSFLGYLHYVGAMEFRRRISTLAQQPRKPSRPRTRLSVAQQLLANAPAAQPGDEAQLRDRQRLAAMVRHLHNRPARIEEEDDDEKLLPFDIVGHAQHWLHGLYASDPFYRGEAPSRDETVFVSAFMGGSQNPMRMLVNVFLGLALQLSAMLGGGARDGDPVRTTAQMASMVAYWELLVYALRLYGWGPVSAALSYVVRLLLFLAPSKANKRAN